MVILTAASLLLTGCWDAIEVNDYDLSTMIILDKRGEEFSFTAEFPRILPSMGGGDAKPKNVYVKGSGSTFAKARDSLETKLDKPLFLGTVRTLCITQNAAADDLARYLFRLREDGSYRQKVAIVITQETPEALTNFENETESPGGFAMDEMLASLEKDGRTFGRNTSQYVESILGGRGFVVNCIGLMDKQLTLTGYSVFRDAKCIGFIPVEQARGLVFLLADKPVWVYRVPFGENFAAVEVEMSGKKIVPTFQEGVIRYSLQMEFKAEVQYFNDVVMFPLDKQAMNEITKNLEQTLRDEIQRTIEQSQKEFQSDYLEFCDAFRCAYPDVYDKLDWAVTYPNAQIEVSTLIDLSVSKKMDYEPS